ncbi:hypothetical protein [Streptomyces sp. NPDC050546]|uniref:hypothetical protein n=1 Tax=Streptomyces sp. NPDC050546 TaxID=3365628 RepID=UPI003793D7A1
MRIGGVEDVPPLLAPLVLRGPAGAGSLDESRDPFAFKPTLGLLIFAAHSFVKQLDVIGPMLGLSATVTALLLSPTATELPEIMNAVIWVGQGWTKLELANILCTQPRSASLVIFARRDSSLPRTEASSPGRSPPALTCTGPSASRTMARILP